MAAETRPSCLPISATISSISAVFAKTTYQPDARNRVAASYQDWREEVDPFFRGMAPSLRDEDWLYGQADAQIFNSINEGRAHGMPSWNTKLTEDQTWRLVAYIKSLRTRNEPEPPS